MRLFMVVHGDEIVVTSEKGFRAAYCKRPNFPQLKVRRCTDTNDQELLAQAWQAANAKARGLGWIVQNLPLVWRLQIKAIKRSAKQFLRAGDAPIGQCHQR